MKVQDEIMTAPEEEGEGDDALFSLEPRRIEVAGTFFHRGPMLQVPLRDVCAASRRDLAFRE